MTTRLTFQGTHLLTVETSREALDFALPILDFMGIDTIPCVGVHNALKATKEDELDDLLCDLIPGYTLIAIAREEAQRSIKRDIAFVGLAGQIPADKVARA